MLVLARRTGEGINIGTDITIKILSVEGGIVRIAIDAPMEVNIVRDDAKVRHRKDASRDGVKESK